MTTYYIWFSFFAIIVFLVATDDSIAKAFYIVIQLIKVQYEKTKWWLLNNPANPIVKYFIWKRSMKMAEQLIKELDEKSKL